VPNPKNEYLYNKKELQEEFTEYDYGARFYDPMVARFTSTDRLAEKFSYMTPYQFCSNSPIWLRELDGLEGVKSTETDANGNKTTIMEKNVVVLTEKKKDPPTGATQKQIDKVTRQNERIARRNADKIASVKSNTNTYYKGADGKDAKDSQGIPIVFKFKVIAVEDFDKSGLSRDQINARYAEISKENGILATATRGGVTLDEVAPAAVITNEGAYGGREGIEEYPGIIRLKGDVGDDNGWLSHELLHTFRVLDNDYQSGGLSNSPPEPIIPSEVDKVIEKSYDKKP
jgi:RHS repeat-associated protein